MACAMACKRTSSSFHLLFLCDKMNQAYGSVHRACNAIRHTNWPTTEASRPFIPKESPDWLIDWPVGGNFAQDDDRLFSWVPFTSSDFASRVNTTACISLFGLPVARVLCKQGRKRAARLFSGPLWCKPSSRVVQSRTIFSSFSGVARCANKTQNWNVNLPLAWPQLWREWRFAFSSSQTWCWSSPWRSGFCSDTIPGRPAKANVEFNFTPEPLTNRSLKVPMCPIHLRQCEKRHGKFVAIQSQNEKFHSSLSLSQQIYSGVQNVV